MKNSLNLENKILKAELKARKIKEKEDLKLLKQQQKLERKLAKEEKKVIEKTIVPEPTEEELVKKYVNRVIKNQQYHGRINSENFTGLEYEKSVSKNLWLDTDFYFSVVFQSRAQKFEFLEKWEQSHSAIENEADDSIKRMMIVNGLLLAKALGIQLKEEFSKDYPTASLDTMPFVLDDINT